MRYYVEVTGISDAFLAFIGYELVADGARFQLYLHVRSRDFAILPKHGQRFLYVDDVNDKIALKDYRFAPCPPWN